MDHGREAAVVTGASAGVGRATAVALARRGFDVGLLARGRAGLDAALAEVEAAGGRGVALEVDVARWEDVDGAAERIESELGPIALWINNAMTTVFGPVAQVSPEEVRRATEVTYLGQVHGTMAALARMRPRDRGRLVSVGSALAYVGIPLQAAYCGAKFACRGFMESVRAELLHEGSAITVSMVHLPAVNTPQFDWCESRLPNKPQPVPPIYTPEACAAAIIDTALARRRNRVFGTWNSLVVLGAKVVPSVLSRFVARTGVDSQQTDERRRPDRPSNLLAPADDEHDFGAHGRFSDRDGGVLDPSFVRLLPATATSLLRAGAEAAVFRLRRSGALRGRA